MMRTILRLRIIDNTQVHWSTPSIDKRVRVRLHACAFELLCSSETKTPPVDPFMFTLYVVWTRPGDKEVADCSSRGDFKEAAIPLLSWQQEHSFEAAVAVAAMNSPYWCFIFYKVYECLYLLITGPPVFQYIESNYGSSENKLAGLILVRHEGDLVYIQVFSLCVQCGCVWRYITCIIYNSAPTVSHHLLGFWSLQTCYQVLFKCFGSLIHFCTELKWQPTLKWLKTLKNIFYVLVLIYLAVGCWWSAISKNTTIRQEVLNTHWTSWTVVGLTV